MNFAVEVSSRFKRNFKPLAKKYPSLTEDISKLIASLALEPQQGTALGKGLYKVRLAISSKGSGRSGGARVITYVKVVAEQVVLAAIYDKSEQATITHAELRAMAKEADGSFE